jgi:hypothetical protein
MGGRDKTPTPSFLFFSLLLIGRTRYARCILSRVTLPMIDGIRNHRRCLFHCASSEVSSTSPFNLVRCPTQRERLHFRGQLMSAIAHFSPDSRSSCLP